MTRVVTFIPDGTLTWGNIKFHIGFNGFTGTWSRAEPTAGVVILVSVIRKTDSAWYTELNQSKCQKFHGWLKLLPALEKIVVSEQRKGKEKSRLKDIQKEKQRGWSSPRDAEDRNGNALINFPFKFLLWFRCKLQVENNQVIIPLAYDSIITMSALAKTENRPLPQNLCR